MGKKKNKQQPEETRDVNHAKELKLEDFYCFVSRHNRMVGFFDENPDLMYISPYRELYEERGHRESGKILEAIYMVYDPKSAGNNAADRSEKEIQKDVAKYFLKDKDFQWSAYRKIIEAYKKDCRHTLEADADFYNRKVDELKKYLDSMPISANAVETTDLLKTYKTLVKDKAEVMKLASNERKQQKYRAGIQKSRVERRPQIKG